MGGSKKETQMHKHKRSRKAVAVSIFTAVVVTGSLAWAAWTVSGSGSAYAKAKNAQALTTVDLTGSVTATLYPGITNGDAQVQFDNPNPYPVHVVSVNFGTPTPSACLVTVGSSFTFGSPVAVPGSGQSTVQTMNGIVSMGSGANDSCQGAVITIPITSLVGTQP